MAASVKLTKTPGGNYNIEITGVDGSNELQPKPFLTGGYSVRQGKIKIVPPDQGYDPIMTEWYPPEEWTVDGVTGFATDVEVAEAIKAFGLGSYAAESGLATAANQALQATALNQPLYDKATCTITRPANTTAYDANDGILGVGGIAAQRFEVAKAAGRGIDLSTLVVFTDDTGLAGKTVSVAFYEESPSTPIADNAAFSYRTANKLIHAGTVDVTFVGNIAQVGVDSNGIMNVIAIPTTTEIFFEVIAKSAFTPSANSTTLTFSVRYIQN